MRSISHAFVVACALSFPLTMISEAHAGIEACGNINIPTNAKCTVETKGGCAAKCEPVSFQAACAVKLAAECRGKCNASATLDCNTRCSASCSGACNVNPPQFDCQANCNLSCQGGCAGQCSSSGNKTECEAKCKASCDGYCTGECKAVPPSATCDAKCKASCNGSCTADANASCQVSCRADGFAACEAELKGGCTVQCQKPEGALFCDGNFIETGNQIQSCINELNKILTVKVDASGSASCVGNECSAEGKASVACAASPAYSASSAPIAAMMIGITTILARFRRFGKRSSSKNTSSRT